MKFGASAFNLDAYKILKSHGYDYVELPFFRINALTEEEFEQLKSDLTLVGFKAEVCNGFFPGDFVLYSYNHETGKEDAEGFKAIEQNVIEYVTRGYERVIQLGCDTVVIGSGGARKIPDDMLPEVAVKQFSRVLELCGELGIKYGISVTVEPLNPKEVNFINTLAESLDIIEKLNHPNVKAMVDFYHEGLQVDPTTSLERAGKKLIHAHIARVEGRTSCNLDDVEYFAPVFAKLKELGYDYRVSFEGRCIGEYSDAMGETKKFFDKVTK